MRSLVRWVRGAAVTTAIVATFTLAASAQGKWVKLAPFPEPDQEISGVAANGIFYVFGGLPGGAEATPTGLIYEYDPTGDKWTGKKKMPLPAHHIAVTQ